MSKLPDPSASFDPELPENEFKAPSPYELDQSVQKNLSEFRELALAIQTTDNKLKSLWILIFENAMTDRKNAYIAFADLYMAVHGKSEQHMMHGQTIAKYLERMEKTNVQLLKLAELIDKAKQRDEEEEEAPLPSKDLFRRLESKTPFTNTPANGKSASQAKI